MVTISCSGKFHAFNLAEELERHGLLDALFTSYSYQKNSLMRRFTGRTDKENIPVKKLKTAVPLAVMMKTWNEPYLWNDLFDRWVANRIGTRMKSKVFIGWSGMSLRAVRRAKELGKNVIIERGSSHIRHQDRILHEEYKKFGIHFRIDPRTVEKELQEYREADYISIPSTFVKNSFLEFGVPEKKLVVNPYGFSQYFKPEKSEFPGGIFRVLYLGSLTIQKGLIYLFQALQQLNLPPNNFEAWFVGKVDDEIKSTVQKYARPNWKFFGHVNHYDLPRYINACDVAVQPSLQDGFGMVILQTLSCGVPVIASANTGGPDVIRDGENGFIVPARNAEIIADRIQLLHDDSRKLEMMKKAAAGIGSQDWSWSHYGNRYASFINSLLENSA